MSTDIFSTNDPAPELGRNHRQSIPSANSYQHTNPGEDHEKVAAQAARHAEKQPPPPQGRRQPQSQSQVASASQAHQQPRQAQQPPLTASQVQAPSITQNLPDGWHFPWLAQTMSVDASQPSLMPLWPRMDASVNLPENPPPSSMSSFMSSSNQPFLDIQGEGDMVNYDDLSLEERADILNDPDANESHNSIFNDARLSQLGPEMDIQVVALPAQKIVHRAANSTLNATPFTDRSSETPSTPPRRLIHRGHVTPPTAGGNKENVSTSSLATVLGKRPLSNEPESDVPPAVDSSDRDDANTVDIEDVPAKTRNGKAGVQASDLVLSCRHILNLSLVKFRQKTYSEAPYPDPTTLEKIAVAAWYESLQDHLENGYIGNAPPTDDELELIKMRTTQLRGQVITCARALVPPYFELKPASTVEELNDNHVNVAVLLNGDVFVCRDHLDSDAPGSLFRARIIQHIINGTAFNNGQKSEGLHGDSFADKITLPTIALICTAIQCAIEEWKTGIKVQIPFTAKQYEVVYHRHLATLQHWEAYTSQPGRSCSTLILQQDLLDGAKIHASVVGSFQSKELVRGISDEEFATDEGPTVVPATCPALAVAAA
ncbi:hypothetical protein C8J56DRAFT_906872 [Mycena floridula]|nr:hypothetical protein C8J56DRAFT_906872 [Mycena floridula]